VGVCIGTTFHSKNLKSIKAKANIRTQNVSRTEKLERKQNQKGQKPVNVCQERLTRSFRGLTKRGQNSRSNPEAELKRGGVHQECGSANNWGGIGARSKVKGGNTFPKNWNYEPIQRARRSTERSGRFNQLGWVWGRTGGGRSQLVIQTVSTTYKKTVEKKGGW